MAKLGYLGPLNPGAIAGISSLGPKMLPKTTFATPLLQKNAPFLIRSWTSEKSGFSPSPNYGEKTRTKNTFSFILIFAFFVNFGPLQLHRAFGYTFSKLAINLEQSDILTPNFYYHVWALYIHRIVLVWIRFKG